MKRAVGVALAKLAANFLTENWQRIWQPILPFSLLLN